MLFNRIGFHFCSFSDKGFDHTRSVSPSKPHIIGQNVLKALPEVPGEIIEGNSMDLGLKVGAHHGLHHCPYVPEPRGSVDNQKELHSGGYHTALQYQQEPMKGWHTKVGHGKVRKVRHYGRPVHQRLLSFHGGREVVHQQIG